MANTGQAVTALLKLDATNFVSGIETATTAIKDLQKYSDNIKLFSRLANGLSVFRRELSKLRSLSTVSSDGLSKLTANITRVGNALTTIKKFESEVKLFRDMISSANQLNSAMDRLAQAQTKTAQSTNSASNSMRSMSSCMISAKAEATSLNNSLNSVSSSAKSSSNNLNTSTQSMANHTLSMNALGTKAQSTSTQLKNLGASSYALKSNVDAVSTSATSASSKFNVLERNVGKSSQTAKAADGRFKTLSGTLFSLRGITSIVGSMFAFNLVQGFIDSTQQAIHAKSQMESYQKTLGLSSNSITSFNKKLTETVGIYQKMNKYSLGETVAGLGIEFDLSEKQMEGMMKTVARLQSEYIRAGRSPEEADLAVKDIMQGEFLRLSRETGVGKEDLKRLGWSGDTKDIDSLQRALDKVADERNWDAFATQATSLSDVFIILKNRIGEFAADLTSIVTPGIIGAFNLISGVFQGINSWYNNSSFFSQGMTQVLGVASAIGVLSTGLIAFKGHMGLVEIASAGFGRSLLGIALGFDKSVIATNSSLTMLKAWIAGTDVGTAKSLSFVQAISSKVLGLNRESVAIMGVTNTLGAMNSSVDLSGKYFKELSDKLMVLKKGTEEYDMALSKLTSALSQAGGMTKLYAQESLKLINTGEVVKKGTKEYSQSLELLKANYAGTNVAMDTNKVSLLRMVPALDASNIKSLSFAQTLATLNKDVNIVKASTMSTKDALKAFATSAAALSLTLSAVLIAALVAVAAAFATVYAKCQETKKSVEGFNNLIENGDDIISDAQNVVNYYEGVKKSAQAHVNNAKSAKELADANKYLKSASEDLSFAQDDLARAENAVTYARTKKQELDNKKTDIDLQHEKRLADLIYQTCGNYDEARNKANQYMSDATSGYADMNHALDEYNNNLERYSDLIGKQENNLKDKGFSSKERADYLEDTNKLALQAASNWQKFDNGDFGAGLVATVQELQLASSDTLALWDKKGPAYAFTDIATSFGGIGAINGIIEEITGTKSTSSIGGVGTLLNLMFGDGHDDLMEANDWLKNNVISPLNSSLNSFLSDPLGSLEDMGGGIGNMAMLLNKLFSGEDPIPAISEFLNNTIINPMMSYLGQFLSDPFGTLSDFGGFGGIASLLNLIFGGEEDPFTAINNYLRTNIITPLTMGIVNGIAEIPILGSILQMLGLVDGGSDTAQSKGQLLMNALKNGIEYVLGNIPILGDILKMLGLIDGSYGTANQKGHNVGKNIKDGEKTGHTGTASNVRAEMNDVINAIAQSVGQAYSAAVSIGNAIWNGINKRLQRHSPGFIHDQVLAEFQNDIPSAINGATSYAFSSAQSVGQAMVNGITPSISQVNQSMMSVMTPNNGQDVNGVEVQPIDPSLNQTAIQQFTNDQLTAEAINTATTSNITTGWNDMDLSIGTTLANMGTGLTTTFTNMNTNQTAALTTMQTQNKTAFNNLQTQTTSSLNNMRNSTQNVTNQMTNAWLHMKNNIVASANQLKTQSTAHFNQLSSTIGGFYRKLQNPSSWGAGDSDAPSRYTNRGRYVRGVKAVNRVLGSHGAGGSVKSSFTYHGAGGLPTRLPQTMDLNSLLKMMCPDVSCIKDISKVDVESFLFSLMDGGFGSWSDWRPTHFNHIKKTSNEWDMKSPQIMGYIDTNTNFKVKEFLNGDPQISFGEFKSMAEALFSAIPYDFYYDSAKCGNWVDALRSGSVNCSDGADALVALAHTCGFSAYKQHGHWNGLGHFYAIVNGQKMDTTGWQQRRTWTPSASAGSPSRNSDIGSTTNNSYNISVVIEGDMYGVDDLEAKIEEGTEKAMAKVVNPSVSIGI